MPRRPRVSAVTIARDEEREVDRCFSSFWDSCDEVVLVVDAGYRDPTVAAARRFARRRGELGKLIVGEFAWCDDFAAARNHADSLASGDWLLTVDLDETVVGASALRPALRAAPGEVEGFLLRRVLPDGSPSDPFGTELFCDRVFRRGVSWTRRVDEFHTASVFRRLSAPSLIHHTPEDPRLALRKQVAIEDLRRLEQTGSAHPALGRWIRMLCWGMAANGDRRGGRRLAARLARSVPVEGRITDCGLDIVANRYAKALAIIDAVLADPELDREQRIAAGTLRVWCLDGLGRDREALAAARRVVRVFPGSPLWRRFGARLGLDVQLRVLATPGVAA
jgi:hypothetical protein